MNGMQETSIFLRRVHFVHGVHLVHFVHRNTKEHEGRWEARMM